MEKIAFSENAVFKKMNFFIVLSKRSYTCVILTDSKNTQDVKKLDPMLSS